jgi:predicted kinase
MLQGLPGSGKSFWAARQEAVVVNKDEIREVLSATTGWVWSQKNEADVIAKRDEIIIAALKEGKNVISSDTNFARVHKVRLEQIARENGAMFEIVKFTDVPIETCIERDKLRDSPVGEKVIRTMASRYIAANAPDIVPYTIPDGDAMSAIICDLDGTLALLNGRSPYDASTCEKDTCNEPIRNILEVYYRFMQWQIIYLSGREDKFRTQTESFLRQNHCPPGPLHMRTAGDYRKDAIIKTEIFDSNIRKKYRVRFVLDDRNQVVEMWRKMGLTCLQCAEGNF